MVIAEGKVAAGHVKEFARPVERPGVLAQGGRERPLLVQQHPARLRFAPIEHLLEPLRRPRFRLLARVHGPTERRRAIWVGERAATVATPHPDGTLALRHEEPSRIGADLVSWLGVRPLPEREGRSAWSCRPLDLTMPGTHTAWVVERRVDDPASMRWVAAVDAGRDGWRTASGSAADRRSANTFRPVGVAAVYVALSHMV